MSWLEQQKIQASDKEANDNFGISVAISSDGNTAIVGAYYEGAAYIFIRTLGVWKGEDWAEQQKIQASDKEAGDYFGYSVAIDGDTAIVGVPCEDTGASNAGFSLAPLGFGLNNKK